LGKFRSKRQALVTIFGLNGKETVGDIAILGQVILELREVFLVASLFLITQDESRSQDSLEELSGGPLMDSLSMPFWLALCVSLRLFPEPGFGSMDAA
jgi:hypothetical protein